MTKFQVYVTPEALREIKNLPGNIRQRVRLAVSALASQPSPFQSKQLEFDDSNILVYRLRLENWRIIYAVNLSEKVIDILAVRKRPPYDYGDLSQLLNTQE